MNIFLCFTFCFVLILNGGEGYKIETVDLDSGEGNSEGKLHEHSVVELLPMINASTTNQIIQNALGISNEANPGVVEAQLVLSNGDHDVVKNHHDEKDEHEDESHEHGDHSNNFQNAHHHQLSTHILDTRHQEMHQVEGGMNNVRSAENEHHHSDDNHSDNNDLNVIEHEDAEDRSHGTRDDATSNNHIADCLLDSCLNNHDSHDSHKDNHNNDENNGQHHVVLAAMEGLHHDLADNDRGDNEHENNHNIDNNRFTTRHRNRHHHGHKNRNNHGKLIHVEEHHRVASYRDDNNNEGHHADKNTHNSEPHGIAFQIDTHGDNDRNDDNDHDDDDHDDEDNHDKLVVNNLHGAVDNHIVENDDDHTTQSITITLPHNHLQEQLTNGHNNVLLNQLINGISSSVNNFQDNEDAHTMSQSLSSVIANTINRASDDHENPNHISIADVINVVNRLRGSYNVHNVNTVTNGHHNDAVNSVNSLNVLDNAVNNNAHVSQEHLTGQLKESFSSLLDEILNNHGNTNVNRLNLQNNLGNHFATNQLGVAGSNNLVNNANTVNSLAGSILRNQNNNLNNVGHVGNNLNGNDAGTVSDVNGDRNIRINIGDGTNQGLQGTGNAATTQLLGNNNNAANALGLNANGLTNLNNANNVAVVGNGVNNLLNNNNVAATNLGVNNHLGINNNLGVNDGRGQQLTQLAALLQNALGQLPMRNSVQAIRKGIVHPQPQKNPIVKKMKKNLKKVKKDKKEKKEKKHKAAKKAKST